MHYDVFNGDADGLCALHQLRLCEPRDAVLVTGVKRDIALLARVRAGRGDTLAVLDVSLDRNREALAALLARGARVQYFDHHHAASRPSHPALDLHLDTSADTCTGLIVDRFLGGRQRLWAIVAAFGDALPGPAAELGRAMALDAGQLAALRELGDALGYNAYGERESDLVIAPAALYRTLSRHADPFDCRRNEPVIERILATREDDLACARAVLPWAESAGGALYVLPDAPWSRRVRGAFGNTRAEADPERAHAILSSDGRDGFVVSVRSPRQSHRGADALCRRYDAGGGRAAAAGIDCLPAADLRRFVADFFAFFG